MPPCGCLELNTGPLKEQVLLSGGSFLQPPLQLLFYILSSLNSLPGNSDYMTLDTVFFFTITELPQFLEHKGNLELFLE